MKAWGRDMAKLKLGVQHGHKEPQACAPLRTVDALASMGAVLAQGSPAMSTPSWANLANTQVGAP